jgi:hypothetical protein
MLIVMLNGGSLRLRIVGALVWCIYLRYSATRALIETIAEWLDDWMNPPGGPA